VLAWSPQEGHRRIRSPWQPAAAPSTSSGTSE
jgi:hypothetical protein